MPDVTEYVGELETLAFNRGYEIKYYKNGNIEFKAVRNSPNFMPRIKGVYNEAKGSFWFEPRATFPESLEARPSGNYVSWLKDWVKAGELIDYMIEHSWNIDEE